MMKIKDKVVESVFKSVLVFFECSSLSLSHKKSTQSNLKMS